MPGVQQTLETPPHDLGPDSSGALIGSPIQENDFAGYGYPSTHIANQILASHTGQPIERIAKDTDRDFYMSADEAKQYGLVDDILTKQKVEQEEE